MKQTKRLRKVAYVCSLGLAGVFTGVSLAQQTAHYSGSTTQNVAMLAAEGQTNAMTLMAQAGQFMTTPQPQPQPATNPSEEALGATATGAPMYEVPPTVVPSIPAPIPLGASIQPYPTAPLALPPPPPPAAPGGGFNLGNRIHLNGFLSAGGAISNNGAHYNIPDRGTVFNEWGFEPVSLIGLQIIADLTDNLSVVAQLVADGDDANGNRPYQVNAAWAFLKYSFNEALQLRAGRFRLPAFLYSETEQVGYTYPWVFLPNEVYRIVPFQNINGVDAIYNMNIGQTGWTASFEPYFGTNNSQYDLYTQGLVVIPPGTTANFDEDYLIGGVFTVGNPYVTLRGTYAHLNLSGSIRNYVIPPTVPVSPIGPVGTTVLFPLFSGQPTDFYEAGGKINFHNFLVVGEYAHRDTPAQIASLSGFYAMLGYQFHKFLPNITYARIETTNNSSLVAAALVGAAETPQSQQSLTLGLAYYISSHLVGKASASLIDPLDGTRGLFNTNPGKDVLLFGISIDAIF